VIPFDRIETVFLDVGNTLVSIDFARVAAALSSLGTAVEVESLRRAEAASRPRISKRFAVTPWQEPEEPFVVYLRGILTELERLRAGSNGRLSALGPQLVPMLRGARASDLWSSVMPRVPESLAALKALGLRLAVVSNSDGTVEQMLRSVSLLDYLDAVIDSAVVGYEKPDPRIFEHALGRVGADPATTLHVGDLYDADVVGARRAGLHALLLDPFGDWTPIDCDTIPEVSALATALARARGAGSA
jgi:putative hydrolase of the HAD superfamily